jgi:hypothetical protein
VKFDESSGSQREQVSQNLVDDEEPPSVSIFRMGTGEVMPLEVQVQAPVDTSNQDPPSSTRVELPSSQAHQEESQFMVTIMDGALIKGENKVVKPKKKTHELKMMMMDLFNVNLNHHAKSASNGSTGSSRRQHTWEHSKRGYNSLKVDKLLCILLICLFFGTS